MAEKVEALSSLGIANSRMKDYFDLWVLAQHTDFDGDILRQAVQSTFDRRNTTLPGQPPYGLTDAFVQDVQKKAQWRAFLQKNRLEALDLGNVIAALATFILPVIEAINADKALRSARLCSPGHLHLHLHLQFLQQALPAHQQDLECLQDHGCQLPIGAVGAGAPIRSIQINTITRLKRSSQIHNAGKTYAALFTIGSPGQQMIAQRRC